MTSKKQKYSEGDLFGVPLADGGFGVGLVVRKSKRGVLFGYFFGPRREDIPALDELHGLEPARSVLAGLFGDLDIRDSLWPVIGGMPGWSRERWPLPYFKGRGESDDGSTVRITRDEDDLTTKLSIVKFPSAASFEGVKDGLMGSGFAALRLNRLIGEDE